MPPAYSWKPITALAKYVTAVDSIIFPTSIEFLRKNKTSLPLNLETKLKVREK
jgi:hypothetical protein